MGWGSHFRHKSICIVCLFSCSSSRRRQAPVQPRLLKFFWVGSFDCSPYVVSTYLIVDSCTVAVLLDLISAFLFSSLSDYFPGELIRTLASENKKPDHIEYDRVSFYIDARLLILGN